MLPAGGVWGLWGAGRVAGRGRRNLLQVCVLGVAISDMLIELVTISALALRPSLSVIIPAFNEAARLPSTLDASLSYLRSLPSADRWEILVVDDGSTDATADLVKNLHSQVAESHRARSCFLG